MTNVTNTIMGTGILGGAFVWTIAHGLASLPLGSMYGAGLGAMVLAGDWIGRKFMPHPAYETESVLKIVKFALVFFITLGSFLIFPLTNPQLGLRAILPLSLKSQILWITIAGLLVATRYIVDEISCALEG